MITKFVLILVLSGQYTGSGKTSLTVEFDSLEQCQYTYKVLTEQIKDRGSATLDTVITGGCFKK